MTLPDLGLETSDEECRHLSRYSELVRNAATVSDSTIKALEVAEKILRDRARLITALSEARGRADAFERLAESERLANKDCEAAAREEERTRVAKIARGNLLYGRYITWPCWNPDGNRGIEDDTAKLGRAIASAIEGNPGNEEGTA